MEEREETSRAEKAKGFLFGHHGQEFWDYGNTLGNDKRSEGRSISFESISTLEAKK